MDFHAKIPLRAFSDLMHAWIARFILVFAGRVNSSYHSFDFAKYAPRYLAAFAYRFNRRFQLDTLPMRLLVASVTIGPRPADWLWLAEASS